MKTKSFYTIILLAIFSSIISVYIISFKDFSTYSNESELGKNLSDNFADKEIVKIKITKPNGRVITLIKNNEEHWSVGNYFGYPADTEKINNLLLELASMRIVQSVTIDRSQLGELDLRAPGNTKEDGTGTEIELIGDSDKLLYRLLAGKKKLDIIGNNTLTKGRFILPWNSRLPVLIEEPLSECDLTAKDFLNTKFITIRNIKDVNLAKGVNEIWSISRKDAKSEFDLSEKPGSTDTGIDAGNVAAIISSLESINFNSVADPSTPIEDNPLDPPYKLTVRTFANKDFVILIGKKVNNYRYLKIDAASFPEGAQWVYLVDDSRLIPLIQKRSDLVGKEKKRSIRNDRLFTSPIGQLYAVN